MATCTQYFTAVDEDGDMVSFDVAVMISKWDGERYVADCAITIPARAMASKSLTKDASYKAKIATKSSSYKDPPDMPFIACGTDITVIYEKVKPDCPTPTASITAVSNYTPGNGVFVDFTSYEYAGAGQSIERRRWDFGDGTSSTEKNPSKAWTNTTGADIDYTVTFTATNDCGKSKSTSTTITVSSPPKKTGIEIQFSDNLNGKDLIAYKAIRTIGDLWWTGPAFADGILWKGGRCAWSGINSSLKYNILVGDACQEKNAIDGIVPERPGYCAGDFNDGDNVVILARNPGFDFRIYTSANLVTLSGSTFQVVYLSSTSGDVIDEAFTGRICGLIGLSAGTECDAFWAEFYDPIFVANYMEIQATGKDMFGNERELGWLDHVAFIASIIGSLPAFNLFPFAGITKAIGEGIMVIVKKMGDLSGDELSRAGGALVNICTKAPKVVQNLIQSEVDELRAALVKVYGDVQGNKYVDEALGIVKTLVDEAYELVSDLNMDEASLATFNQLLIDNPELGIELTTKYTNALTGTPVDGVEVAIINHAISKHIGDIIEMYTGASIAVKDTLANKLSLFKHIGEDYDEIVHHEGAVNSQKWVRAWARTALIKLRNPEHIAIDVPDALDEYTHLGHILASDLPKKIAKVPDNFAETPIAEWKPAAKESAQSFSESCWEIWDAMKDSAKLSNVELMAALSMGFATVVLGGLYLYTVSSQDQAAKYALSHAQFVFSLDELYWPCHHAEDDERWDDLAKLIVGYADKLKEAEEDLAFREDVLKADGTYPDFARDLQLHQFNLNHFVSVLNAATNTGTLKVSANVKGFYAQLDGTGDMVSDWQSREVIFNGVEAGEHHAFLTKGGYTSCTTPSGTVTPGNITEVRCDLAPGACILPVPTIDAPLTAAARAGIQFKSSATTESLIKWLEWDFGDGDQSRQQNPSHMYWKPGDYLIQLTVTDDCGTVTAEYTITITSADGIAPGEPTPTETPDDNLPSGTATVNVKRPVSSKTGRGIVWPTDCFIHIDGQYSGDTAPQPFSFGGWKELPIGKHTFKIIAEGYQDESVEIDLKIGDEIDWAPYMDPVGYTPPVGEPPVTDPPVAEPPASGEYAIEFLIPDGATMTLTPKTTVPHITVRSTFTDNMRRLSER